MFQFFFIIIMNKCIKFFFFLINGVIEICQRFGPPLVGGGKVLTLEFNSMKFQQM